MDIYNGNCIMNDKKCPSKRNIDRYCDLDDVYEQGLCFKPPNTRSGKLDNNDIFVIQL